MRGVSNALPRLDPVLLWGSRDGIDKLTAHSQKGSTCGSGGGRPLVAVGPIQASPIEETSSAFSLLSLLPLYVDRRCCARALHVSLYLGYTATGDAALDARCSLPDDQLRLNPPRCSQLLFEWLHRDCHERCGFNLYPVPPYE